MDNNNTAQELAMAIVEHAEEIAEETLAETIKLNGATIYTKKHQINSKAELKDIIANMDADVYIVRNHVEDIFEWLENDNYTGFTEEDIAEVLGELRADPYFQKIAKDIA